MQFVSLNHHISAIKNKIEYNNQVQFVIGTKQLADAAKIAQQNSFGLQ